MSQTQRAREYLQAHPDANARDLAEAWGVPWTESFGTLVSRARCTLRDPDGVKAREREYRQFKRGQPPTGPATDRQAALLLDAIAAKFEPGMSWANTHLWGVTRVQTLDQLGGNIALFDAPENLRVAWNT
jgi:hypothetical protein